MRQVIIKNSGKYSHSGVYPNIGWTTFSKYFPFNDVRYDKMKHNESKKNLDPKNKLNRDKKYEIALTRLIEYCRFNNIFKSYEDFHKITDIPTITLGTLKNKLFEQLSKVDFDAISKIVEAKRKKEDEKGYCKCGKELGVKNRTGLCGECYYASIRKDTSANSIKVEKMKKEKEELKELRKIKKRYDKIIEMKEKRKLRKLKKLKEKEIYSSNNERNININIANENKVENNEGFMNND